MAVTSLVDTNDFLEILLGQSKKERCKKLLQDNSGTCGLSDFSLHSVGVILFRARRESAYASFLQDILPSLEILHLEKSHYNLVIEARQRFGLDFDDAYQFALAKSLGLSLAIQDRDFERVRNEINLRLF